MLQLCKYYVFFENLQAIRIFNSQFSWNVKLLNLLVEMGRVKDYKTV